MMTRVQITEEFSQDNHTSQRPHWDPRHIQSSQSCPPSFLKMFLAQSHHFEISISSSSLSHRALYPSEVLTTSRSPPLL